MNPLVLIAMDKNNHNKAELKINSEAAYNVAAHDIAPSDDPYHLVAYAVYDITYKAYAAHDGLKASIREYFEITGEDKQVYINAIEWSK